MTRSSFASLGSSTFSTLVRARQAYTAALKAVDAAEELCTCPGTSRRCTCAAAPIIKAAERAHSEAGAARAEREAAWVEFHAILAA